MRDIFKRYTEEEYAQLYQVVGEEFNSDVVASLKHAVRNLFNPQEDKGFCIYRHSLTDEECEMVKNRELYGESKVFVILVEDHTLVFRFFSRHLHKFLFETNISEMPLYIHSHFVNKIAIWRLQIAK